MYQTKYRVYLISKATIKGRKYSLFVVALNSFYEEVFPACQEKIQCEFLSCVVSYILEVLYRKGDFFYGTAAVGVSGGLIPFCGFQGL